MENSIVIFFKPYSNRKWNQLLVLSLNVELDNFVVEMKQILKSVKVYWNLIFEYSKITYCVFIMTE